MDEMLTRILSCIGNKHGAQKELAEHLGIHPNVITNWKNGTNKSYRGYINEIADFYGVSIDYLLTGEQKEKSPSITGEGNTNQSIVGPEEIKAAFWGGDKDLSKEDMDAMWNDVKRFADFVAQQKKQEKKNG